jgi:S-adenosylmethionine decarboxylase
VSSIQNFISREILDDYQAIDVNNYQENLFHTKMFRKEIDIDHYLFAGRDRSRTTAKAEQTRIRKAVFREIQEIYYGRNLDL